MNRKSERRDTEAKMANHKLHANPIILVTDPQTSTTTHRHALIFIRSLVKEKDENNHEAQHVETHVQLSERYG